MAADRSHRADERARCDYGALGMATLVHTLTHSVESLPLGAGMALHLPVWSNTQPVNRTENMDCEITLEALKLLQDQLTFKLCICYNI